MSVPFSSEAAAVNQLPEERTVSRCRPSRPSMHEGPIGEPIRRHRGEALPQMRILALRPHLDNGSLRIWPFEPVEDKPTGNPRARQELDGQRKICWCGHRPP